ncbi:MAG: hypothetical protein COV65_02165 [Nitrosopumilales archaeon CG11_big_fil_rev_8_21_14_0_20_33_24]|nr:MAG: hypothetical protein COV65_02165 [Nitrosopumilales archaeon CG11_big_fil_rev_8_21_14_0_20_33_24]
MTVKKAIEILDSYTKKKTEVKNGIKDPKKSWNNSLDLVKQVADMIGDLMETDLIVLEEIRTELVPKCKHPKKMIDTLPNGQKYCMNCNLDL